MARPPACPPKSDRSDGARRPRPGKGAGQGGQRKPGGSDKRGGPDGSDKPRAPKTARGAALDILDQVLGHGRLMSELPNAYDGLSAPDRARAQRLATQTLRGLERLDRMLQKNLRKPPDLRIRNILRLALLELAEGGDAHGIVNEAVALAGARSKTAHFKGLVNAVLRKESEEAPARYAALRVPRLPKWLRGPLVEAWGPDAVAAMETVHFAGAPLDLTPKAPAEAAAWAERLGADLLPTGSLRLADGGQVTALEGFEAGDWWVQDAAAAVPARLLAAQPGEKVLDLCAAPGGKTMQLAATGAAVTALDLSDTRLARVRENLARTGLEAEILAADMFDITDGGYDAILLDAPCSATGTIRRHPDLPHARDGAGIGELIELQSRMIDHALTLLKPGGRLVFCTCSLIPDEGEVQVEEALSRHAGLTVDRAAAEALPGIDQAWVGPEGGLRLRPDYWADRGGMDGFYAALLRR
ncbi:RsmB/NOP family class I SAM-dependent RNA methyltransferase [Mesobacterium pallidum]|uniref:RsmB/NOP family class I SAM-dependent RNA methyltransferase n=1 Tax=Mesobacterium pallidum TaxID=2872037 RepID=UPI0023430662|nr:transcription antitermination factor NusB [Mesobacterium pallidum]